MLLLLLLACAPHVLTPAVAPAASPALPPDCPIGASDPAARLSQGEALIAGSMVGEHPIGWGYRWGLQALLEAADAGYPPALYAWGKERFGRLYLDRSPDPESLAESQAYIDAIAAIGSSARLGHPQAVSYFPEPVMAALLDPQLPLPTLGEDDGLADVPAAWWQAAREIVDHHRRCWPDP